MLSWCVYIKNRKMAVEKMASLKDPLPKRNLKIAMKANEKENDKEATEEIFKIFANSPQMIAEQKAAVGDNAKKIPATVATPFPPLNFSHIG